MENQNETPPLRRRSSHRRRKSKNRVLTTGLKVIILVVMAFATCGATYAAKLLAEVNSTVNNAYRPRSSQTANGDVAVSDKNDEVDPLKDPISILILGIDDNSDRNLGSCRTDSMILATINPESGNVSMVSIPRDTITMVETSQFTGYSKINEAYTYGSDEASIKTVEALTNVPVTFYVTVDFQSLIDIVNALGGIEVEVPYDINEHYAGDNSGKLLIPAGTQTLDGDQALIFSRIRKMDDDIQRGKRQVEVIQKIIQKALQVGSISKYSSVLNAINGHFWTDMTMDTMLSIAQVGLNKNLSFNSYSFAWTDGSTGSYVGLYEDSLNYVSHKLRYNLGLDTADERDAEGYEFHSDYTTISAKTPVGTETPTGNSSIATVEDEDTSNAYSNPNSTNTNSGSSVSSGTSQWSQNGSQGSQSGSGTSSSSGTAVEVPTTPVDDGSNGAVDDGSNTWTAPSDNVAGGGTEVQAPEGGGEEVQ